MGILQESLLLCGEYFVIGFINLRFLKIKCSRYYFLFLFVLIVVSIEVFHFFGPFSSALFGIFLTILAFNFESNKFVAVISGTLSISLYIFLNYVLGFLLTKIKVYDVLTLPQVVGMVLITYLLIGSLISIKIKELLFYLTRQKETGWVLTFLCLLTLSSYYALIFNEYYFDSHSYRGMTNLFFITLYGGILIVGTIFSVGLIRQSLKNKLLEKEQQSLTEYTILLEDTNNAIRNFRHDYKNILLTIDTFLEEKSYDELSHYFYTSILPTISELDQDGFKLSKATNIESKELKSLVIHKALIAQRKGVDTIIEVPEKTMRLPNKQTITVIRGLGIILDNAIEGAITTEYPSIKMAFIQTKELMTIVVENSCLSSIPPIHQLKEAGFSTKGEGRGNGLSILQDLVRNSAQIFLETKIENDHFTQKIVVRMNEEG